MSSIGEALFPKAKREVLSLLFGHPQRDFHVREVARACGIAAGQAQRELRKLSRAGLLLGSRRGRMVLYRANDRCPIFDELRGIVRKVLATVPRLARALAPLSTGVEVAFVYGSVARATDDAESDIDVMVIGDATFAEVVAALRPAEGDLGRPVNPTVYPTQEWLEKLDATHHFVTTVARAEKLYIIGDDDVLGALSGQRVDSTTHDVEA